MEIPVKTIDLFKAIREELEVKLCPAPDGKETFVLCRSADRKAMTKRLEGAVRSLTAATLRGSGTSRTMHVRSASTSRRPCPTCSTAGCTCGFDIER